MEIVPSEATLGASIYEVNLHQLDDRTGKRIIEAWHEYGVLAFPEQHLDDEAHIAFSRRFGHLERLLTTAIEGTKPEIFRVANVRPDGTRDSAGGPYDALNRGNRQWHSDSSYKRLTAKASALRAHTLPSSGGETQFADMRAAYDALDTARKDWLADKLVVHDFAYSHGKTADLMTDAERAALPPVAHPVVRIHEETGRKSLFVGRHASHIVGEDVERSRSLLRELTESACQPPRIFTHRWQAGDLVIWDNRCVLHRGRPWPPDEPRILFRTTVACDDPDNEWQLSR